MQTRYYDPTIRRFINADNYELLPVLAKTLGQLNLYAYANNNPLMNVDMSGEGIVSLLILITCTVLFVGFGLGVGLSLGHTGWQLVGDVMLGAAIGIMAGNIVNMSIGMTATILKLKFISKPAAIRLAFRSFGLFDLVGVVTATLKHVSFQPIEATPNPNQDNSILPPNIEKTIDDYYIVGGVN